MTNTTLTAEEILKGIHHAAVRIDAKLKEIEQLNSMICRVTQVLGDPVSGSKTQADDAIVLLMVLREEIQGEIKELTGIRNYAVSLIDQVENAMFVGILYARHVNGETFEEIAVKMCLSYRQVMRLHKEAVAAVETIRTAQLGRALA